ncbi:hypothetical protein GOC93_18510 [Sinorhizobium medicae]|nr:hypothetical protein [Sinorhizobium medicae]MDX1089195.1 hypothetical protein [Sinorhizobium medicae]
MTNEHRNFRQRLLALAAASIGTLAASAFSYGAAIYRAANPEPLRTAALGETVDTGRWLVTVTGSRVSDLPRTGRKPLEPKTFLLVEFEADNRSASTAYLPSKLFTFASQEGKLASPTFYLARDKAIGGALHPGMPERLTAVWEWPAGETPPRELKLLIGSQIYKKRDNLYGASSWLDRDPAAVVPLVIAAKTEGAAPS